MSSNSDIESEIINQVRQETLEKYREYIDQVYFENSSQNEKLDLNGTVFVGLEQSRFMSRNGQAANNDNPLVEEHTDYFELLQTCGNTHLNKLMLVFASLVKELNYLSYSANDFITQLVLYRENCTVVANEAISVDSMDEFNSDESSDDDEYSATATMLSVLFEMICFLKRCYEVASHVVLQKHLMLAYASLPTNDRDVVHSNLREILPDLHSAFRFDVVWTALASLTVALVNLDRVFAFQANTLRRDIFNYKRSLEMVSKNLAKFDLQSKVNDIQALLTLINEVQRELFDGHIASFGSTDQTNNGQDIELLFYKGLVVSVLNTNLSENGVISKNMTLNENLGAFVKQVCQDMEQNKEHNRLVDDRRLLATAGLYSLYVHLFWRDSDRKLTKSLTETQRKLNISFVHLQGNISISPDQLLIYTLPKGMLDKKTLDYFVNQRESLLKANCLEGQVKSINLIISQWLVTMEQSLNSGFYSDIHDGDTLKLVFTHIQLLKEGYEHVRTLYNLVRNCVAIHYQCNRPVSRADTIALCKSVNLLKGVERFFVRHHKMLVELNAHYQKYNSCALLIYLTRTKEKILSNVHNYSEQKLDLLSAIILAANCLNGPVLTEHRYTLTSLCLSYAMPYPGAFSTEDLIKILNLNRRIHVHINLLVNIHHMFDCEFLYFNRAILQVYFGHFYDCSSPTNTSWSCSPCLTNISELQYFFSALDDALPMLESLDNQRQSKQLINAFVEDVFYNFLTHFLNPLCKDFEDELRFQTHSHLQVGDKSPFVRNQKDFHSLLSAEPFKLGAGRRIIWIKAYVENYLNELAYNMTSIALHDWKTYESMLGYARDKFGLQFASLQLPTRTLEQGLDVLEITRNIHIFVQAYLYNLNNQFFVERSSPNKHLNVLTIRHVANSIQTHGFGIINSTVNFAYQYLRRKLQILSQFIYQEQVKSKLVKEARQFRELIAKQVNNATNSHHVVKYPFERAEKLARSLRRISEGENYLDKFRQVLTHIGNVLGFVRMLRSGALHCTSDLANFVPDLDDLGHFSFEDLLREESDTFNKETVAAIKNFDAVLNTITTNFSDKTDYFHLLVEVFRKLAQDPKHIHLRNFYLILPATTYNYVEHIIISKEKLARKNKDDGTTFTDDGFAMGVIYVLKLLGQLSDFDSLHWFSSIEEHVRMSIQRSNEVATNRNLNSVTTNNTLVNNTSPPIDDKLLQTTSLTLKRLEIFHREFQLLKFAMTSCRILFKSSI